MRTTHPLASTRATATAVLLACLAACGGGSDEPTDDTPSAATTQSVAANSTALPTEAAKASAETLATTQAVVAGGQAGQTFVCPGGGTAQFTVTGGSIASVTNGQLDAGEVYALQFNACRGSSGAAAVNGAMGLTVVAASAGGVTVDTATQALGVTLPQRTLTMSGSSRLAETVVTTGATTVTTVRWISPQIQLTSVRAGGSGSLTLTDIDQTRSVSLTNGVVGATSGSGTITLAAMLPNASWSATVASNGNVSYDANGLPLQGEWSVTLPNSRIDIQAGGGTVTVSVDHGPDGSIDRTYTFGTAVLGAQAA